MLGGMHQRALASSAAAYVVLHHLGLVPAGLGAAPEGTRWLDWLDLLVPWVVVGLVVWAVWSAHPPAKVLVVFLAGAVAYTSGHGMHLAANSINNVAPSPTAHLWDEPVAHHVWFAGVALLAASLAWGMARAPRGGVLAHGLAVGVGATWASNAIGGEAVALGVIGAVVALCWGWRHRRDLGGLFVTVGGVALVWLALAALMQ